MSLSFGGGQSDAGGVCAEVVNEDGDNALEFTHCQTTLEAAVACEAKPAMGEADSASLPLHHDRPSRQTFGITGLFLSVGDAMKKQRQAPTYTTGELEEMIYDNACHHRQSWRSGGLLNYDELICTEEEPDRMGCGVWRCIIDWRVEVCDALALVSVIITGFTAPLTFIWGGYYMNLDSSGWRWKVVKCDIVMDFVFTAYLMLRLNTSFLHPTRHVEVVRRRQIVMWLLHSPFYCLSWFSISAYMWIICFKMQLLVNNIKVVRGLLLLSFPDSLWRFQDRSLVRLARPVLILVMASHWVACVLTYAGGYAEQVPMIGKEPDFRDYEKRLRMTGVDRIVSGEISLYLMSFVDALYMLTGSLDNPLGDGGVREESFGSLVVVSIFGPVGCVVVALFIAAIIREHTLSVALDMRHEENKAFIARALSVLDIPRDLQRRVYSMHYFQKMGHDLEAFGELFNRKNLSPPLENALLAYLYMDSVLGSRYFIGKDLNYIIAVIGVLQDQVYVPGDYVARRGEVGNQMFFVARGALSILVPHPHDTNIAKATHVGYVGKGDFFGEVALIKDCVRTAWVRTDTYVLVSALARSRIEGIWKYFPEERAKLVGSVQEVGKKDQQRIRNLAAKASDENRAQKSVQFHFSETSSSDSSESENCLQPASKGNTQSSRTARGSVHNALVMPLKSTEADRRSRGSTCESLGSLSPSRRSGRSSRGTKLKSTKRASKLLTAHEAVKNAVVDDEASLLQAPPEASGVDVTTVLDRLGQLQRHIDEVMDRQISLENIVQCALEALPDKTLPSRPRNSVQKVLEARAACRNKLESALASGQLEKELEEAVQKEPKLAENQRDLDRIRSQVDTRGDFAAPSRAACAEALHAGGIRCMVTTTTTAAIEKGSAMVDTTSIAGFRQGDQIAISRSEIRTIKSIIAGRDKGFLLDSPVVSSYATGVDVTNITHDVSSKVSAEPMTLEAKFHPPERKRRLRTGSMPGRNADSYSEENLGSAPISNNRARPNSAKHVLPTDTEAVETPPCVVAGDRRGYDMSSIQKIDTDVAMPATPSRSRPEHDPKSAPPPPWRDDEPPMFSAVGTSEQPAPISHSASPHASKEAPLHKVAAGEQRHGHFVPGTLRLSDYHVTSNRGYASLQECLSEPKSVANASSDHSCNQNTQVDVPDLPRQARRDSNVSLSTQADILLS